MEMGLKSERLWRDESFKMVYIIFMSSEDFLRGHGEYSQLMEWWRNPKGVEVFYDHLRFLYLPRDVEAAMVFEIARQIHTRQREAIDGGSKGLTRGVVLTMGGMNPGCLLADHLQTPFNLGGAASLLFDSLWVSVYDQPGVRRDEPKILQDISMDVDGENVLVADDLLDSGVTLAYVAAYLRKRGATGVHFAGFFAKQKFTPNGGNSFGLDGVSVFGYVPPDTWVITSRERVETLMKRVPIWLSNGADGYACRGMLLAIGYEEALVDYYLPAVLNGYNGSSLGKKTGLG